MSIKKVWEIIKNFNCAELAIVQEPAMAVWQEQQKRIEELESKVTDLSKNLKDRELAVLVRQERIDELKDQLADMKEYFDMQEYLYQGDSYNRGWNSALVLIKEHLAKVLKGGDE
ncbi:hypothetical protein P255_01439 [Acinetobacter brisouii CIP 110357]|uniref:Uncharacterized protein n=1 Tax=Acinetobacter brisouii CIP 110357 TaxID=1341683 RepID=V2VT78_9GAMM|nr:hypothetical protein [Acinetobacter brisouii]ENV46036.1 hypothetical protein F954_02861 [Acinetobacter brisouii ANC 4119]ESK50939.1 hypothetical protein P255_01439 [Acinetobacter brisouii CIP 110357]